MTFLSGLGRVWIAACERRSIILARTSEQNQLRFCRRPTQHSRRNLEPMANCERLANDSMERGYGSRKS